MKNLKYRKYFKEPIFQRVYVVNDNGENVEYRWPYQSCQKLKDR